MPVTNEQTGSLRGVWNGERPETAEELVHEEYVIHDRELAEELQGFELYTTLASATRELFSDVSSTIEDVVADGDVVALRWTMVGTQDGPLYRVEPTGKRAELTAIEINCFQDDELVETSAVDADLLASPVARGCDR